MTTSTVDALVADYLRRLSAAAAAMPPERRSDLLSGIEEHIADARAAGAAADEAAVRTLLDRLGEPEEIVAAARDEDGGPAVAYPPSGYPPPGYPRSPQQSAAPPAAAAAQGTGVELAAVLLMTVGSFVPLVGWLVGVALLWSSRLWRTGEKLLGTFVIPGGPGLLLLLGFVVPGRTCFESTTGSVQVFPSPGFDAGFDQPAQVIESTGSCSGGLPLPTLVTVALVAVLLLAPVVVAVVLYRRAQARAALEPAVAVPERTGRWGGLEIAAVVLLGLGSFVMPLVGPLVGLVLVYVSQQWTSTEKVVATLLAFLPPVLLVLAGLSLSVGGL